MQDRLIEADFKQLDALDNLPQDDAVVDAGREELLRRS
jgi:hypothetical protein